MVFVGLDEMMQEFEQQHDTQNVVDPTIDVNTTINEPELELVETPTTEPVIEVNNLAFIDPAGSLEGAKAVTLEELEDLYNKHARHMGFSVRRGTQRGGQVMAKEKYFVCSCEGQSNKARSKDLSPSTSSLNMRKRKQRIYPDTRMGCKANIRCKLNIVGTTTWYNVVHHNIFHNHDLTRLEWQHLHRSERKITEEKAKAILSFEEAGIGPTDTYRYWSNDAGGDEHVGHTLRDHINHINRLRMKQIEEGDAETLIQQLREEAEKDPDFFFRVRTDEMGKFISCFWCDSMMREDYRIYGDVLIFDTTYRTNRYNLIYAPFVGVNNHWKNVMFGCAI